jgi:hypothetical protein
VDSVRGELLETAEVYGPQAFNGVEYAAVDQWATDLDMQRLHEILGPRIWSVVSPVAYKLEAELHQRPELKAAVEEITHKYPKPQKRLSAKRIKG